MLGYRRSFGPESVVELSKNIGVQHEDFLRQDDNDKKADALRYMAGYAVQYLHLVPQEKKFTFKETERVLHNSAMNIGDFDPREGSLAFCNLAKYAENLLEQPWRRDFHVIKLTSGFYVHNVAAQLQNAHEILIVMGYVNIDDTTLELLPKLNFNNLKAVSRDCYVASQECLILSQIWQQVADQEPDYPLTIGEVFEYRKNHLGDTDTICNKLLYDIRQRMHTAKQQQQLSMALKATQRFVPVDRLIDYDMDDTVNTDEPDLNFLPERESERVSDLMKNVALTNHYQQNQRSHHHQEDEHIYDPVYGSAGMDLPNYPRRHPGDRELYIQQQQQKANNNASYYYNSRKTMPPSNHGYQYHNNFNNATNNIMYSDQQSRNSVSPMIPKTVTSMFSSNNGMSSLSSSRNNVSKSNSMNSISGRGGISNSSSSSSQQIYPPQPLTLSKVKETDLDADPNPPRDPYYNHERNNKVRRSLPENRPVPNHTSNQVYPDEYYPPGIVKPVAVYGSTINPPTAVPAPPPAQYYSRTRQSSDNSEDVLNEAYAYASEVNQIPKVSSLGRANQVVPPPCGSPVKKGHQQQAYQHQATPIPMQASDSDSHSSSRDTSIPRELALPSNNKGTQRSGSSTDASSWEGSVLEADYGRAVVVPSPQQQNVAVKQGRKSETAKRPSHIDIRPSNGIRDWRAEANHQRQSASALHNSDIRYADSSPESDLVQQSTTAQQQPRVKNGYRELSSSSSASSSSPASSSSTSRHYPRNEELSSLDTVYYDYLLKQGQTDEVLRNVPVKSSNVESRRQPTSSTSNRSSQQHVPASQTHAESEEDHLYDGRRVVKKRQRESGPARLDHDDAPGNSHNQRVIVKKKTPTESHDPNYNFSTAEVHKPSHDKTMKKVGKCDPSGVVVDRKERVPVESEIPAVVKKQLPPQPWDCRFCTFRNLKEERICEVCAKSKDFFEDDEPDAATPVASGPPPPPLVPVPAVAIPKMYSVPNSSVSSGPPHYGSNESPEELPCPQCTLLNPIQARACDACNFRLKPVDTPPEAQVGANL